MQTFNMLFNILISEKVNTINNIKIFLFFFIFVLTFFLWHIIISIVVKISQFNLCRCGGTGRRTGLKILRLNKPCRFDSGHLHQKVEILTNFNFFYFYSKVLILLHFSCFHYSIYFQNFLSLFVVFLLLLGICSE